MVDINKIKAEAEKEVREEKEKKAKEQIKSLIRKRDAAKLVLDNIDREIADAYKLIGEGNPTDPT